MRYIKLCSCVTLAIVLIGLAKAACCADAIHDAAERGDVDAVKRLIAEDSARLNARTADGVTPLLIAASRGKLEVARVLINAGADSSLRWHGDWTPLLVAVADGDDDAHVEIARLCFNMGRILT